MSSTIEERTAYLQNPFFTKHLYGNFSPFYITIAICTVIGAFIIALNLVIACCSKHRQYWLDRHTGNRWLVSIWSATPHKQPPLDLTELEDVQSFAPPPANIEYDRQFEAVAYQKQHEGRGYSQRHPYQQHQHHHHPHHHVSEEYVELQQKKVESDI